MTSTVTRTRRWQVEGPAGELELVEVDLPTPAAHQLVVATEAVSLNYRDRMTIENDRGLPLDYPFTPGSDLAGRVVAVGSAVTRFAPGDRVVAVFTPDWVDGRRPGDAREPWYRTLGGFYPGVLAEHVLLDEEWLVRAPSSLDAAEASTLPVAALTAWFALVERGRVAAGQTVLVEGTGGVSLFAVQIAAMHGARVVVSGSAGKLDRVRELGADEVVDRRRSDWADAILALTGDRGVDHVLEVVGGAHLDAASSVVAVGGHIHLIGSLDGFEVSTALMPLLLKDVTVHGIATGHRAALERLVAAIDVNGLRPVIDRRLPFAEVPAAMSRLAEGPFGKIVVDVGLAATPAQ